MLILKRMTNKIADYGDFREIYNIDAIIDSVINVLGTIKGTYIFDPYYGTDLMKYVFDPLDEITIESVKNEVVDVLSTYVPAVSVKNITIGKTGDKTILCDIELKFQEETDSIVLIVGDGFVQLLKDN